jgi:hypothetical protein
MVFFVISRAGFESYHSLCGAGAPLWGCAGLLDVDELAALRAKSVYVTDFNYILEPNDYAGIAGALETIREHHPAQIVWVGL